MMIAKCIWLKSKHFCDRIHFTGTSIPLPNPSQSRAMPPDATPADLQMVQAKPSFYISATEVILVFCYAQVGGSPCLGGTYVTHSSP